MDPPAEPPDVETLRRLVAAHVHADPAALGLGPGPLDVAWVMNWGGFVNASFRVSDGTRAVRLKLASGAEEVAALRRWREIASVLWERYRAPRMLGWIAITGTSREGPVFEWVDGASPPAVDAELRAVVGETLEHLHGDGALAAHLANGVRPASCRAACLAVYDARFRGDLEGLERERPPFVDEAEVAWMRNEADALLAEVEASAAFDVPADCPTHGDLWLENVLRGDGGRVVILDWDGVALGDPAMDWAMFLGPTCAAVRAGDAAALPTSRSADAAFRRRFDLYARAALLDWAIDPLADWVEARVLGVEADAFRRAAERTSRAALAAYRAPRR